MTDLSHLSDDELMAAIHGHLSAPAAPQAALTNPTVGSIESFGRGASFGLSDRLSAAMSSMIGSQQSAGEYGDFGGTYSENLKSNQAAGEQFHNEHPYLDFAANAAGTIASGVPVTKALAAVPAVAGAMKALPRVGQLAAGGAAAGAAAGAGNAPEDEMLSGGAKGAATGAVIGAALPPVLAVTGKVADTILGIPARAIINALRTPGSQAYRLLAKALERDGITPQVLAQRLKEIGPQAMVADAGGKNTLGLADLATTIPGEAKDAGLAALEARAKGAGNRVGESLKKSLNVASTGADEIVQGLHGNMRALSPAYEKALDGATVPTTGNLAILADDPIIRSAIDAAKKIIRTDSTISKLEGKGALDAIEKQISGIEVTPTQTERAFGQNVPLIGTGKMTVTHESAPTLRAWDYVKRGLDSIIEDNSDQITGKMNNLGRQASILKSRLLGELDAIHPEYANARSAYADEKAGESALNLGRKFMHEDFDVTDRRLAEMTPAERKYFQAGAARAVIDKIEASPDTGMAYSRFQKTPGLRRKLEAAFGDDKDAFKSFMADLDKEVQMGQTHASVGKNSWTAARQAAAQDAGMPITTAIPSSKLGIVKAALDHITKPNSEVSAQLLKAVLSQDPAEQQATIKALEQLKEQMSRKIISPATASRANAFTAATAAPAVNSFVRDYSSSRN